MNESLISVTEFTYIRRRRNFFQDGTKAKGITRANGSTAASLRFKTRTSDGIDIAKRYFDVNDIAEQVDVAVDGVLEVVQAGRKILGVSSTKTYLNGLSDK